MRSPDEEELQRQPPPTKRARRWVPPYPGMTPRFTSGWPNWAFSEASADVACHGQLASPAQSEAVDGGDDRLGEGLDGPEDALPEEGELPSALRIQPRDLADVGAGHEGLLPRSGEDHRAHGPVRGGGREGLGKVLQGPAVEGVELVRAVDGDDGDAVLDLVQHVRKIHIGLRVVSYGRRVLGGGLQPVPAWARSTNLNRSMPNPTWAPDLMGVRTPVGIRLPLMKVPLSVPTSSAM